MNQIVVVDKNWNIGKDGGLLVHLPEDLKYFKANTLGKVVVMGRETLFSLPKQKPLPDRTTVILSTTLEPSDSYLICRSVEETLELLKQYKEEDVFIAGGESVYRQFLPYCDKLYITKIEDTYIADKRYPNIDAEKCWVLESESETKHHNGTDFKFTIYIRK